MNEKLMQALAAAYSAGGRLAEYAMDNQHLLATTVDLDADDEAVLRELHDQMEKIHSVTSAFLRIV